MRYTQLVKSKFWKVLVYTSVGLHVSKREQQFVSCVECDRAEAPTNEALGTGVAARLKIRGPVTGSIVSCERRTAVSACPAPL